MSRISYSFVSYTSFGLFFCKVSARHTGFLLSAPGEVESLRQMLDKELEGVHICIVVTLGMKSRTVLHVHLCAHSPEVLFRISSLIFKHYSRIRLDN